MRQIQRSSVQSHTEQRLETLDPNGCEEGFSGLYDVVDVELDDKYRLVGLFNMLVCRQTGHPAPCHFWRHEQWKTCWQRIVSSPVVSSIRSRHTGQVGSSIRSGVGGGKGFGELYPGTVDGMKGSWWSPGKLALGAVGVSKVIDLIKATLQVSGFRKVRHGFAILVR